MLHAACCCRRWPGGEPAVCTVHCKAQQCMMADNGMHATPACRLPVRALPLPARRPRCQVLRPLPARLPRLVRQTVRLPPAAPAGACCSARGNPSAAPAQRCRPTAQLRPALQTGSCRAAQRPRGVSRHQLAWGTSLRSRAPDIPWQRWRRHTQCCITQKQHRRARTPGQRPGLGHRVVAHARRQEGGERGGQPGQHAPEGARRAFPWLQGV